MDDLLTRAWFSGIQLYHLISSCTLHWFNISHKPLNYSPCPAKTVSNRPVQQQHEEGDHVQQDHHHHRRRHLDTAQQAGGAISPPHLTWRPRPIHIEGAVCSAPLSVPYGLHSTLCTHVDCRRPHIEDAECSVFWPNYGLLPCKGYHTYKGCRMICTPIYSIYNVL